MTSKALWLSMACLLVAACGGGETTLYALVSRDADADVGLPVKMKGDTVGEVTEVALAENDMLLLTLSLPDDQAKLVPVDSTVKLKRTALVVGEPFLEIELGQAAAAAEGDTLRTEPSWWDRQREKLGDVMAGVRDPELRSRLDAFRRDAEEAARGGRDRWAELHPRLQERLNEIYQYAQETVPQIAGKIREQLQRLLDEAERLFIEGSD